jgi:hypothetical protein
LFGGDCKNEVLNNALAQDHIYVVPGLYAHQCIAVYAQFLNTIDKTKERSKTTKETVSDHFVDVNKMISKL